MKKPAANCVATATMATPHTPKRVMTRRFSTTHTIQPLRLRSTKYFCFSSIINICPETIFRATPIILNDKICKIAIEAPYFKPNVHNTIYWEHKDVKMAHNTHDHTVTFINISAFLRYESRLYFRSLTSSGLTVCMRMVGT